MMRLVTTLTALAGPSLAPLPGHATTFTAGEFVTFAQGAWGSGFGEPAMLLDHGRA
jgi:hypothetical protein